MKSLIKNAIKVGNSAGILLPKSWQGGKIKAVLIEEPRNIEKEVLGLIWKYLYCTMGVYIAGSYARNEADEDSDIDILVITKGINKEITSGRYHISLMDLKTITSGLTKSLFYLLSLIKEAKVLINASLLNELKELKINNESLRWHIETSRSSLKVVKAILKVEEIENRKKLESNDFIYPLILRLREAYIVGCLLENREYSTKDLLKALGQIIGDEEAIKIYKIYRLLRDNKRTNEKADITTIKKLINLLEEILKKQEKWLTEKKD